MVEDRERAEIKTVVDSQPIVAIGSEERVDSSLPPVRDQWIGLSLDGRFEIVEQIGAGGMSVVYKAKQIAMDRFVAVKTMKFNLSPKLDGAARFRREIKSLALLNHPHIVSVYDCIFSSEGQPFVVMDYLEGQSLDAILHDGPLHPQRALRLFLQMCSALEHAHKHGIIHRDLKPSNVIIMGEGDDEYVKILDFGLAKLGEETTKLTTSGEVFGSPPYMCPEQCRGETCDVRSDVYSLGVLMYEVLVGKDPFYGCSFWNLLMKHIHATPPPFAEMNSALDINSEFEKIVFKCLEKEPLDRFQSMAELKEGLQNMQRRAGTTRNEFITNADVARVESLKDPVKSQSGFGVIAIGIIVALLLVAAVAAAYQFTIQAPKAVSAPPAVPSASTTTVPQPEAVSRTETVHTHKASGEKAVSSRSKPRATRVTHSRPTQLIKSTRQMSTAAVHTSTPVTAQPRQTAVKSPWARLNQLRSQNN